MRGGEDPPLDFPPGPDPEQVHWLLGREGGLGLMAVPGLPEHVMLFTGEPGALERNCFLLSRQAREAMVDMLGRFGSSGSLADPSSWPSIGWGPGSFPSL